MRTKCSYCFTRFKAADLVCGTCKIDPTKDKSTLTVAEKKIADRCRTLYTIGFLNIVGALIGLFLLLPAIFYYLRGQQNKNLVTVSPFLPYYVVFMAILLVLLPFFGLALRRYKKGCYQVGIGLYSALILIHLPGAHVAMILIASFFLYNIASPPSKEILNKTFY